ncbi:MAG: hypothetical protein ACLGGX_03250 [Bdellovibrionia bacterium]
MKYTILILSLFLTSKAFSWGARGHHAICATAAFLVKEQGLKEYLKHKPQMMGHLCNIPDFYWKSLGPEIGKLGNPTHFVDVEVIGLKAEEIPTDYKKLIETYTGTENKFKKEGAKIFSMPQEFGSSWWRAEQFLRRAFALEKDFSTSTPPKDSKEEQKEDLPFNKTAFEFVVNLGLMGHFVGDNAQPFHTSADYDGWEAGHGGIHAYYEEAVVGEFDGNLDALVLAEAKKMKSPSFLKPKTKIERMRALGAISFNEIPKILKLDPIIKKSSLSKEKGMSLRTPAERKSAQVGFQKMNKMIVTQMARAAVLLAHTWDEAYVQVGRPPLAKYKSYKYPFTPDFVAPDYH